MKPNAADATNNQQGAKGYGIQGTLICRLLVISGRVQGVCFRHYTRQTALKNGVNGWVRNLPDGRVEALLEGDKIAVEATIAWCHQGPETARVDRVDIEETTTDEKFSGFTIR